MGPSKLNLQINNSTTLKNGVTTRSQNQSLKNIEQIGKDDSQGKRKAEGSPVKGKEVKRSAFCDITNAGGKSSIFQDVQTKKHSKKLVIQPRMANIRNKNKVTTCRSSQSSMLKTTLSTRTKQLAPLKTVSDVEKLPVPGKSTLVITKVKGGEIAKEELSSTLLAEQLKKKVRILSSNRFSLSSEESSRDNSLYVSALENFSDENDASEVNDTVEVNEDSSRENMEIARQLPPGVEDFDLEGVDDVTQVSTYAMHIFEYLKSRELKFVVGDYMPRQPNLTQWMRTLLVDWMVEVQESFELNHETLYLAIKLVDLYLMKEKVTKEILQLVGAASMFISSKFDERMPPLIDDFLYICDGAYTHNDLVRMEIKVLRVINFDLGMPLSYRFLRRYARCAKVAMPTLTLARYILELSLMEYSFISYSESQVAVSAMLLALKMMSISGWTPTLEYYSGYKLEDIKHIVYKLNAMLNKKSKGAVGTIRNKYSHKIFFEVAKTPLLQNLDL